MPEKKYEYDVFISFSSFDKDWALKLSASLQKKNIKVFVDRERIDVGVPWEMALADALQKSKHLVALWSNQAKSSDWVNKEMARFEAIADPHALQRLEQEQKLLVVNLQGRNNAYQSTQAINDLLDANVYERGADAVDEGLWKKIIDRLADVILLRDASIPIPVAILTMTRDELDDLPKKFLEELKNKLDLEIVQLRPCYGIDRSDWQPFGSKTPVRQVLDTLFEGVNSQLQKSNPKVEIRFRGRLLDDDFWTDNAATTRYANEMRSQPSVIVLDPLALENATVRRRLDFLRDCLSSEKCTVIVLPPFTFPKLVLNLRQLLKRIGAPTLDPWMEPPIPANGRPRANCGISVGDADDLRPPFLTSLGQYLFQPETKETPGFLSVASRKP